MNREAELAAALDGLVDIVERVGCGDWRNERGQRLKDTKQWVVAYLAATKKAQPAVPAEVARAVQILRQHNQWRRGADNNHWQATPYSPAELGRAIDTVCDHVTHTAQPDVLKRATEYAHDIVTWLHRDHYSDNKNFEPFGDLLGLLSQIDNMICGWKESAQPAVPDDVAKDAARYRWLRADSPNAYMVIRESAHLIDEKFDAAIDAAILSSTEGRSNE